jgi:hypothetical protein
MMQTIVLMLRFVATVFYFDAARLDFRPGSIENLDARVVLSDLIGDGSLVRQVAPPLLRLRDPLQEPEAPLD